MKKVYISALIMATVLFAAGCSDPVAKFYKSSELCEKAPNDELVVTEGTLVLPNSFYSTGSYASLLLSTDNPKGKWPTVQIYFLKERKNTMERITDGYTDEDIKIYDNDGNPVKLGEKVRITGKKWTDCIINVDKIEKVK